MSITKKDVGHAAELARLALTQEETSLYTAQIKRILDYVEKLSQLNVSGKPPLPVGAPMQSMGRLRSNGSPAPLKNVWRGDDCRESLSHDEALLNAPEKGRGCFRVPKIIE